MQICKFMNVQWLSLLVSRIKKEEQHHFVQFSA